MLISAGVFIYQNKIINEGEHHLNCCGGDTALSERVANSCDGDGALSEHVVNSCDW